jgi:hypothetical protein
MKYIGLFTVLIVMFNISCSSTLSLNQEGVEKLAIKTVMDNQVTSWNKGDIDAFMEGYIKSEELKFIGSKGITRGWQSTLERYKKSYPDLATMGKLTFTDLEYKFTSKSSAIVYGKYILQREKDQPKGFFTLNWQKINGKWLIISDHTSG